MNDANIIQTTIKQELGLFQIRVTPVTENRVEIELLNSCKVIKRVLSSTYHHFHATMDAWMDLLPISGIIQDDATDAVIVNLR